MIQPKLILTLALVSFGLASTGQTIEQKIKTIDSLATSIDNNRELVEGITEGTVRKKKGKIIGGFSTYDLKESVTGNLHRIRHYVATDYYYMTTFYYSDKKFIKATVLVQHWKADFLVGTICSTTYHFDNGQVIKIGGENKKYSNAIGILELAQEFQTSYTKRTP